MISAKGLTQGYTRDEAIVSSLTSLNFSAKKIITLKISVYKST
jgi:hypothetical protein